MKHLLLAAALLVPATFAGAATRADLTDEVKAQITEQLSAEGYEVRQIKIEDGMYEVYALKDGAMLEIHLDDSFAIAEVKGED